MSESFPDKINRLEHEPRLEAGPSPEKVELLEAMNKQAKGAEQGQAAELQQSRSAVQEVAPSQANPFEKAARTEASAAASTNTFVPLNLQKLTQSRSMKQVQRHLTPANRAFSRVIHQPAVRAISTVTGNTLSRPSGLFGGGIVALMGTSIYLYLAKHNGFTYNYVVFLVLFAGGFALGLMLEFGVYLAMRGRQPKA